MVAGMDRDDASQLADTILAAASAESAEKLRAMLIGTFAIMEAPVAKLVTHAGGLKAYLLSSHSLLIAHISTQQPSVDFQHVDLAKVRLTRSCHDAENTATGGTWTATWRLIDDHINEEFVGQEGPESADDVGLFAQAMAKAAGWPVVALGDG
jgi:hypothetical protein